MGKSVQSNSINKGGKILRIVYNGNNPHHGEYTESSLPEPPNGISRKVQAQGQIQAGQHQMTTTEKRGGEGRGARILQINYT